MEKGDYIDCTFLSEKENDYITIRFSRYIDVYNGRELILQYDINDLNVNGAVYIGNALYYTKNEDNIIYVYELGYLEGKNVLSNYENVRILKCINNSRQWFILEIDKTQLIAYDLINRKILFMLPIQHNFIDIAVRQDNYSIMIGDDMKYEMDDFINFYDHTLQCSFIYNMINGDVQLIDQLQVHVFVDDFDDRETAKTSSKHTMKYPLFDSYLFYWLKELSISAYGKYIIYYSEDFKGIIISEFENGDIYRLFVLPKIYKNESQYYFNEITNVLTIVDGGIIEQYIVQQESNERISTLNKLYNSFYENSKNARNDDEFEMLFKECLLGGKCKKMEYKFDIALSFAGEDREYVDKIANELKNKGLRIFYDKFETSNLWGKDLYQYLSHIYKDNARYCVIFISNFYKNKAWTRHELRNAQNRALFENKEYILPVFLENVELDGLNNTIGYIKASEFSESEIVKLILEKCNRD